MSSKAFLNAVAARRSYYNISPQSPIKQSAIKDIIDQAVLHVPSAYNVQGGRVVLLFEEAHKELWRLVREHTMEWLPKDDEKKVKMQSGKLDGYAAGYGTVLFMEDDDTLEASKKRAPPTNGVNLFEKWTEASSAMLQFVVWTALEAEGFGASLQHHVDMVQALPPSLHQRFGIPTQWRFTALMPFGVPLSGPGQEGAPEKTFKPIDERVKVLRNAPERSSNTSGKGTTAEGGKKTDEAVRIEA